MGAWYDADEQHSKRRDAGFVKGIGKGLVGAVAQPVSGGLDLFSSAFEGLDASKDQLLGKPRASILLRRKRLPRVIGGDGKLQPFVRDGTERQVCVAWAPVMVELERDVPPIAYSMLLQTNWLADCSQQHQPNQRSLSRHSPVL